MTRLELAAQRAKEFEEQQKQYEKQKENKTSSRLELAQQRTQELYKQIEEANKISQAQKEYSSKYYGPYQTHTNAESTVKENTTQQTANNKKRYDLYETAKQKNWANSPNPTQRAMAYQMGLKSDEGESNWLKTPENLKDNLRRFENGYNFGDVTKTIAETTGETLLDIGATVAELPTRAVKGALSVSEGIAQAGASAIAGVSDLVGQDKFANALRKQIANTNPITGGINKFNENLDKYTFTGKTLDSTSEGIGQSLAQMATGYALNAVKIPATIPIKFGKHVLNMPITAFIAGTGSSAQETYQKAEQQLNGIENATWKEKVQMSLKIVGGGAIEGVAEGMFGLLGVGGSDITDEFAKKAISRATTAFDKQLVNIMIAGGGEALEEFISYAGNWLWNNGIVNNLGNIDYSQNWNWDDVMQQMTSAFLSAGISQGGTSIIQTNKATQNAEKYAQQLVGRTLTQDEKNAIKNNVTDMVLGAKQNLEKQSMYPATQKAIDTQIVDETKRRNIEYLRNKYGLNVNQDMTIVNQSTNVIDRLKQKYNLQRDEYNITETTPDTNLKTTPQNNTNFAKTTPINENISQNNVQNVSNLQKTVQNNSTIQGLEDYTEQDIKDLVSDYIEDITNEKISDIALINEDGNIKAKVYYNGNLNEIEPLQVEGKQIKIEQQMYEESDVFEDRANYDVDINVKNNYNVNNEDTELYDDGRATRMGGLINEFMDKLTSKQWNTYFKRIDNDGKKYNFGNNEKSVIPIGNKLVFSNYINGKPQVYDIVKLEARLLKIYGMTAKQFSDTFINKLVKEGYNETEIREFIRNLGEETLFERNDTSSNITTNRSERTSKNDRQVDRTSENGNERKQLLQEDGKLNSNNDVENSEEQGSFSMAEIDNVRYDVIPTLKNGFYSQLENVIINKMQKQARAEDIMNLIQKNGVKQDEIAWTGIDDFLANKEIVTKNEVLEYIRANQIEIEEVIKDSYQKKADEKRISEVASKMFELQQEAYKIMKKYDIYMWNGEAFDKIQDFLNQNSKSEIYSLVDLNNFAKKSENEYYLDGEEGQSFTLKEMHKDMDILLDMYRENQKLDEEYEQLINKSYDNTGKRPRYRKHSTQWQDNYDNYREVLFKLSNVKDANSFSSVHWKEQNVLAHTRLNDYNDVSGNKVLFIEEIQSDLHQEGRKKGYYDQELRNQYNELALKVKGAINEWTEGTISTEEFKRIEKEYKEFRKKYPNIGDEYPNMPSNKFPFKKNWHEFVLRKIINEAVEQGYDKVAWTTGAQQNDRYNLAKYINEIRYSENEEGSYSITTIDKDRHENFFRAQTENELEELVGKKIAKQITNGEYDVKGIVPGVEEGIRNGIIENVDLEIGGEGMKGFYDKIIPEYLSKYLKKWNSKLEEVIIPDSEGNNHVQQGFTITPEMVGAIKKIGQPLYDKQIDDITRNTIIQKIVDTLKVDIKTNKETLKQVASEIKTLIKGEQFTIDNIDRIISELGNKLKVANAPEQKGQRRRNLATYWVEELGYDSWHEVAEELKAQLIELRNDYGELETDKKAIAASPEIRDVLKQAGFTEFEIYDPANAYIQNILEILEKDKDYYAKTLKQIEQETFVTGEKRMNTILNKRRHDVQSGKTPANPNYLKGASLSAMRKEVEKYLGKKVGLKGFRKRAYGIYKMNLDTIRVKDISNMETTIHELGHRINFKELDENLEGASREELNALAERAFLNMYDDEPNVKLQEGWAEFTKRFVVDNQTTLKEYPELSNYMLEQLSNNPRVERVITTLINMAEQYVNAPVEMQIRKMQSIGEDTGKQEKRSFFDKYMYEVHDDLWDIKQLTRGFAKSMGTNIWELSPSDNVYNLMRALRANEDRVLNVMKFGLIDDNGIRRTKGMTEIMERLNNNPEKAQKVRDLLIAMRTLDYASVNLETGLAPEEALSLIVKYSKDTDIMNAANDIINFQEEIMKYAVYKGLMKVEDYQEMKKWNKLYIPLKRVFEGKNNSSNTRVGASNLTKRRTGSTREIIDPFESIIQNTAMILTKINQNEIIKTLADLQQRTGLADYFEEVDPGQRLKAEVSLEMFQGVLEAEGVDTDEIDLDVVKRIFSPVMNDDKTMTIGYMDGGKLKAIEFKDKNIYDVITGADNGLISKTNLVLNTLDKFTGLLRLGATTGNLEFALPNMISDTTTAWLFSESGFVPAVDTMRGLVDYMVANYDWAGKLVKSGKYKENNKYMYDLYKQSGATMATRVASYRPEVQEYVLEVFGKHVNDLMSNDISKMKKAGKAILQGLLKAPQKIQDVLSIIPEISEQATRFESFKKDYNYFKKKGYSHKNALLQATVNTRDITMDFNRMGHSMRAYNRIKAFSAARAQGIYRFIEGVEKMPKKVLSKVGILTAISLSILAAANASGNDKEKEITDQKRKDNFIIPLGANGDIITIKKPQGTVRSIINFAELIYNVGTGKIKEENYNQAWLNWVRDTVEENSPIELDLKEGNDFYSTISSATLPTALEPIIENALNRDFYYGNPIIPYGKENLRNEDQYDENTSQTAILIGKALKQSPAKVENLITGWFAGVGQQVLNISDFVLGKTVPSIPEAPKKNKDEAFITKRFFVSGYKNSESVSQIYDMINKLEDLKEYNEATEEQLKQLKQLNTAKETMSLLNKKMKAIRNNLSLSAKQKQKEMLKLQELRTDTARYYLGKTLIKNTNKRQIELYEYYPASTEYTYELKNKIKVKVQYTEKDQQRYAEIWKETYEEDLLKFEMNKKYYTMTDEEREKEIESIKTKARNKAQDEVSKEVYEREH